MLLSRVILLLSKLGSCRAETLKEYMALLRLRSLLARKRARAGPETTLVVWRLFDTSTAVGVPDPCFWLVVEYAWLGNWRRP